MLGLRIGLHSTLDVVHPEGKGKKRCIMVFIGLSQELTYHVLSEMLFLYYCNRLFHRKCSHSLYFYYSHHTLVMLFHNYF